MKAKSILAALFLMVTGLLTACSSSSDGSGANAESEMMEDDVPLFEPEYVDLGLPSGTLWATCNVGAYSPEEYGDYFAWGETDTKSYYSWGTYFDTDTDYGGAFNKYDYDSGGLVELQPEDDAATVFWGSNWQMPSLEQIKELCDSRYTTATWTKHNYKNGCKITSKSNGNSIFLPAAGEYYKDELQSAGISCRYWSRSLYASKAAHFLYIFDSKYGPQTNGLYRKYGLSVRPVRCQ